MEVDRSHMTGKILSLTLKIIYLLTGEDYVPIKRSDDDNITASLPPSHERKNEEKILELTNKIIELLTGEDCDCDEGTSSASGGKKDEYGKGEPMTSTEEDNIHVWATLKCKEEEIPMAICADQSNQTDSRDKNISQGDEAQCKEEEIPTDISSGKSNISHMHQSSQGPVDVTQNMVDLLVGRREDSSETKNARLNIVVIDAGEDKLRFKEEEEEIPIGPRSDCSENKFQKAPRPLNSKECTETEDEESDDTDTETEEDEDDSVSGLKIIVKSEEVVTHVKIKEEVASAIIPDGTKACLEHQTSKQDTAASTADKKIFPFNRKLVTAEKPFFCADCGGFFKHKSSLVLHRRIHSGEKPFTCSHCGKEFIQKANYIRHQRLHTGEKPYKCTECGKLYAQKQSLILHQKFHAENEPFSCPECGENFIRQSHLVNHRKTHKGLKRYSCPDCGDFFMLRSSLVIHQRVHSAEKPLTSSVD
ncbi:gastrula zinc finger protein XlCGF48.2-like isoform X2 [Bufo bufo]|uniref:gastrula zinc finger protein XlCGF48.2-like isoform X2 n=1 Tax=Bufo bufo TaxID=8384 RepID=UPI001ABE465F|nr:gastrula zinc finger protein XlCGF48.2-like isoform X2 [Bufo bufo]